MFNTVAPYVGNKLSTRWWQDRRSWYEFKMFTCEQRVQRVDQMGLISNTVLPVSIMAKRRERNGDRDWEMNCVNSMPLEIDFEMLGNKWFIHLHQEVANIFWKGPVAKDFRLLGATYGCCCFCFSSFPSPHPSADSPSSSSILSLGRTTEAARIWPALTPVLHPGS